VNLSALRRQLHHELTTLPAGPTRAAVQARLRNVERELMEIELRRDRLRGRDGF
jgi:hypothetical protein